MRRDGDVHCGLRSRFHILKVLLTALCIVYLYKWFYVAFRAQSCSALLVLSNDANSDSRGVDPGFSDLKPCQLECDVIPISNYQLLS